MLGCERASGAQKPCCVGGAGQGWSRVPQGASTLEGCASVCLSWASGTSATRVGSGAGPEDALGAPETGRSGRGRGGCRLCSAPQLSACPCLLAVTGISWETQVPAVGNGESEPVEKIEKTMVSLAQRENQVKTGLSDD